MQAHWLDDTIVAPATPTGQSAIAIIRVSGKKSIPIVSHFFKGVDLNTVASHTIHYGFLIQNGNEIVDEVMVSVFKGPKTYTKEDLVEIQCHGNPLIVQQICEMCIRGGCRLAEPGEFTKRAFLNGRIDLSQAEAVGDLIAAQNQKATAIALQHIKGGVKHHLQDIRSQIIDLAALLELELDFSEEDVEFVNRSELIDKIQQLQLQAKQLLNSFQQGNAIRNGIPVVIAGKPNVGKSTLLNALLQEDRAIVSSIAGTTRDTIEDVLHLDGILFRFIDTAGLRDSEDIIESLGIERSKLKIAEANIILLVMDANQPIAELQQEVAHMTIRKDQTCICVMNKCDIMGLCNGYDVEEAMMTLTGYDAIALSAKSGENLNALLDLLRKISNTLTEGDNLIITNARHTEALKQVLNSCNAVEFGLENGVTTERIAHDLKIALHALGSITGEIDMDIDVLGTIFSKFCIGK